MTWNVHRGYDRAGIARGLARLRAELDPDLLLLQEVPAAGGEGLWEREGVAASLAGLALVWAPMHRVLQQDAYYDFDLSGQLTAAKVPIASCAVVPLPSVSVAKLGAAHRFRRIGLVTEAKVAGGTVTVANVHLENTARPGGRARQMAALVARLGTGPAVIAGDLNTCFGAAEPAWAVAVEAGFRRLVTRPRRRLVPRLDHVLVRDLTGVECRELRVAGSDHRPVAATVAPHSR